MSKVQEYHDGVPLSGKLSKIVGNVKYEIAYCPDKMIGFGADSRVYEATEVSCRILNSLERYSFNSQHVIKFGKCRKTTRQIYLTMISQTEKCKHVENLLLFCADSYGCSFLLAERLDINFADILTRATQEVIGRDLADQCANGLNYLHDTLGIIHGDLKENNIMYSLRDSCFKLIDFGHSLRINSRGSTKVAITDLRKSPRIWADETDYDGNVDFWSLGTVLFYFITRRHMALSLLYPPRQKRPKRINLTGSALIPLYNSLLLNQILIHNITEYEQLQLVYILSRNNDDQKYRQNDFFQICTPTE